MDEVKKNPWNESLRQMGCETAVTAAMLLELQSQHVRVLRYPFLREYLELSPEKLTKSWYKTHGVDQFSGTLTLADLDTMAFLNRLIALSWFFRGSRQFVQERFPQYAYLLPEQLAVTPDFESPEMRT